MFLVLEKLLIIKLKTILHCNYFYIGLFIFLGLYVLLNINLDNNGSSYDLDDTNFTMLIDNYNFDGNKLSLTLKGKENLVASYYIDTYQDLLYLKDNIKYGVLVRVVGELSKPNNNTILNAFNYKKYLNNNDIYYILNIENLEICSNDVSFIYNIKNIINERISKIDNTGYMKAFILGDKNDINSEVYDKYLKIGITHLFALSGMHVGLLSGIILKLLRRLGDLKKYLVIDIFLVIYGFVVGFPSSIKRCILFYIFNSINKMFNINLSSLKLLMLVIFALILYNYKIIFDVGFIYSVCTVFGIILCNKYINCSNRLLSSFRLSLIAFLFSLPISLSNFYEINILSIFYNMFYVPLVSIFIYPLSLLSFFIPFCYDVFKFSIYILEISSNFLASFSFFNVYLNLNLIQVLLVYLLLISVFVLRRYKLIILLFLFVIFDLIIPYFDSSSNILYFDVGQGDCILLTTPYRREVILIDTGGIKSYVREDWMEKESYYVSDNIVSYMKSVGIKKVNYFIISHGDYDHMGEAINLVNNFKVEKVIFNCGEFNELEKELIKVLDKKKIPYYFCIKELNIDDNKLYFLNNKDYGNENDNSSVIYTELNNHKFLFMGDAGVEVEEDLIKKYNLQDIDVLKVGHHGSKTSSSKIFIDEIKPKYSIISVGKNNRYGHPNKEVLDNLNDSKIYRTDKDGSVMFKIKNNKLKIETCAP